MSGLEAWPSLFPAGPCTPQASGTWTTGLETISPTQGDRGESLGRYTQCLSPGLAYRRRSVDAGCSGVAGILSVGGSSSWANRTGQHHVSLKAVPRHVTDEPMSSARQPLRWHQHHSHFTEEGTEALRGQCTERPRSPSQVAGLNTPPDLCRYWWPSRFILGA